MKTMTHTSEQLSIQESISFMSKAFFEANQAKIAKENKNTTDHLENYITDVRQVLHYIGEHGWTPTTQKEVREQLSQSRFKLMSDMVNHMTSPEIFSYLPKHIGQGYADLKISIAQLQKAVDASASSPAELHLS